MKTLLKNMTAAIAALFIALVALPQATQAQTTEAYAVEKGTTLTFYYDANRASRIGTVYGINDKHYDDSQYPAWAGSYTFKNDRITKVVFDTSFKDYKPTTMNYWFIYCSTLQTFEGFENLNTEEVTDMSWMFSYCTSLTSLSLVNLNTAKVKSVLRMFNGCSALITVDLTGFDTASLNDASYMFLGCRALTTIYCDDDWNSGGSLRNSDKMFARCDKLMGAVAYDENKVDASMANPTTGYFTKGREAYVVENGSTLTFYFDANKATRTGTVYGIDQKYSDFPNHPIWSGVSYELDNDRIEKVVFDSSFKDYKPTDTRYWFSYCSKIATIEGLSNLSTDQVTNMYGMFIACINLSSLDASTFNTSKVTNMFCMFSDCRELTSLDVSNFNTENVTDMGYMFSDCFKLTSLDVTNFNTANVTDMSCMFFGSKSLTSIDVSSFNTEKVTDMQSMFQKCSELKTIYCDDDWDSGTETNSKKMFYDCSKLKGAVAFDASKVDVTMANPTTGYFTRTDGSVGIKSYGIYIAGTQVTSGNCKDLSVIDGVLGSVRFDPKNNVLTLKYAHISGSLNGVTGIEHNLESALTIKLEGDNKIDCNDTGIDISGDTRIEGEGYLNVVSHYMDAITIRKNKTLTIEEKAEVSAVGATHGIFGSNSGEESVCVNNATVSAQGKSGSICGLKSMTLTECAISTPLGAAFDASKRGVALNGEIVNSTVMIMLKDSGIDAVTTDVPAARRGIYNLQGIKMQGSIEELPAGIYIVDGKKVVKK